MRGKYNKDRFLPSRFACRDKTAGMMPQQRDVPVKATARRVAADIAIPISQLAS